MSRIYNSKKFYFHYTTAFDKDNLFDLIKKECECINKKLKLCVIAHMLDNTFVYCELNKKIHTTNRYFMAFSKDEIFYIPLFLPPRPKIKIMKLINNNMDVILEYGIDINKYLIARKKHKKFIL